MVLDLLVTVPWTLGCGLFWKPAVQKLVDVVCVFSCVRRSGACVCGCGVNKTVTNEPKTCSVLPCDATQDPMNKARSLMNLPAEPVLAEDSDEPEDLPAAKRPKTAAVVEKALDQDMREVPPQSVPVLNIACCGFIY